jgi:curved DNA-binding protein CbpA
MANRIIENPVPLILKTILKDKASGELIVKGENFEKRLYFIKGDLVSARTNLIQERLGEILFKIGKIGRAQFWNIHKLLEGKNEKVGKILVRNDILTQRDLFLALIYQVRIIAISTFSLFSGDWDFIQKIPKIPEDSSFKIDLADVITEGIKRLRNTSYYRNRYYYHSLKVNPVPGSLQQTLSQEIVKFAGLLKNFDNLPNEKIVSELKIAEDTYWRNVVLLFLVNIIEFVEVKIEKDISKNIDEIIRLYEKLRSNKIDYYDLFALKSNATLDEIKNVYFSFAKKYHPDRVAQAPDPEIKEKSNFVFSEINKAYEILTDDDKRREYDTKGHPDGAGDEAAREKMVERARTLFRKAKTLYDGKKFWEAVALLEEAIRISNDKASYFLLLGICQIELPSMRRVAEKNLQKAAELEPWNVEAYAALGLLFVAESQYKRAEGFFRKALSINPDHALSRKKLNEILGTGEKKKKFSFFGKSKK